MVRKLLPRTTGPESPYQGRTYAYISAYNKEGLKFILESAAIDASRVYTLSFAYHMFGRNMGSLTVTAQARDGTWAELWHLSGDQGKNWHLKSINLPPGSQAVKFAAVAGYVYSDLAIDDVKCEAAAITTTTTGSLSPSPSPVPVTTVTSTTSSSPPPNGGMAITMSFCVKGQVGSDWAAHQDVLPLTTPPWQNQMPAVALPLARLLWWAMGVVMIGSIVR